ncbi:MAG: transporter [Verrucomicrobiota bacterium]
MKIKSIQSLAFLTTLCLYPAPLQAEEANAAVESAPAEPADSEALALKLANPIASLISVPFQNNFDFGSGPDGDGSKYLLNFQPVIPFDLNEDWNLITRTIIPYVYQNDVFGTSDNPSGSQSGLSDTVQSFWFSPKKPTSSGWVLGAGPVILYPTATNSLLGAEKWGSGPTAIALKQSGGWTYGALANQIWSFAGDNDRDEVNQIFLQPFLSFTTKQATTYALNTESTYQWETGQWLAPVNLMVSQLVKFGKQPVQFQVGGRWYAEGPDGGAEWGLRFAVTLLFPK